MGEIAGRLGRADRAEQGQLEGGERGRRAGGREVARSRAQPGALARGLRGDLPEAAVGLRAGRLVHDLVVLAHLLDDLDQTGAEVVGVVDHETAGRVRDVTEERALQRIPRDRRPLHHGPTGSVASIGRRRSTRTRQRIRRRRSAQALDDARHGAPVADAPDREPAGVHAVDRHVGSVGRIDRLFVEQGHAFGELAVLGEVNDGLAAPDLAESTGEGADGVDRVHALDAARQVGDLSVHRRGHLDDLRRGAPTGKIGAGGNPTASRRGDDRGRSQTGRDPFRFVAARRDPHRRHELLRLAREGLQQPHRLVQLVDREPGVGREALRQQVEGASAGRGGVRHRQAIEQDDDEVGPGGRGRGGFGRRRDLGGTARRCRDGGSGARPRTSRNETIVHASPSSKTWTSSWRRSVMGRSRPSRATMSSTTTCDSARKVGGGSWAARVWVTTSAASPAPQRREAGPRPDAARDHGAIPGILDPAPG